MTVRELRKLLFDLPDQDAEIHVDAHGLPGLGEVWGMHVGDVTVASQAPNRTWGYDNDENEVIIEVWAP